MATQHALIRIDPARYAVVERELLALTANSANELAALYMACERPLTEPVVQAFVRAFASGAESAKRRMRAELLAELVAEKSWDLDKALPYLAEVCAIVPELASMRSFTQLRPCEFRIEDGCQGDHLGGLLVLWSYEDLRALLPTLNSYTRTDLAQEIANCAHDQRAWWHQRTAQRLCRSVDHWTGAYLWTAWEQVADAVREVTAEAAWLGCVAV